MNEYEIELKYIGKGRKPIYTNTEYGFGTNPPIVIHAQNRRNAMKQLDLPKTVKIRKITRV